MRRRLTIRTGRPARGQVLLAAFLCAACGASLTADSERAAGDEQVAELPAGAEPIAAQDVDTLYRSSSLGSIEPRREVVRDREAWEAVWTEIHAMVTPVESAPAVDFSTRQLLVLATGGRPTGGYAIDVTGLATADGALYVTVRTTSPGPACIVTMAVTHPTLVLAVPDVTTQVVFLEEEAVSSCS